MAAVTPKISIRETPLSPNSPALTTSSSLKTNVDTKSQDETITLSGLKLAIYRKVEAAVKSLQQNITLDLDKMTNELLIISNFKKGPIILEKLIQFLNRKNFNKMVCLTNLALNQTENASITPEKAEIILNFSFIHRSLELLNMAALLHNLKVKLRKFAKKLQETEFRPSQIAAINSAIDVVEDSTKDTVENIYRQNIKAALKIFREEFLQLDENYTTFIDQGQIELELYLNQLSAEKFAKLIAVFLIDPYCQKIIATLDFMQENSHLYPGFKSPAERYPAQNFSYLLPGDNALQPDRKTAIETTAINNSLNSTFSEEMKKSKEVFQKMRDSIHLLKTVSGIEQITEMDSDKELVIGTEVDLDFATKNYFLDQLLPQNVAIETQYRNKMLQLTSKLATYLEKELAKIDNNNINEAYSEVIGKAPAFPLSPKPLSKKNPRKVYEALKQAKAGNFAIHPETLEKMNAEDFDIEFDVIAIHKPPNVKELGCCAPELEKNAVMLKKNPYLQATQALAVSYVGKQILSVLPNTALMSGTRYLLLVEALLAPALFASGCYVLANPKKPRNVFIRMIESGSEAAVAFSYTLGFSIASYRFDPSRNANISPSPARDILWKLILSGPMGAAIFYLIWNALSPETKEYWFPEHTRWSYVRKTLDIVSNLFYMAGLFQLFSVSILGVSGTEIAEGWKKLVYELGPMAPAILFTWAKFYTSWAERSQSIALNLCGAGFSISLIRDLAGVMGSNDPALLGKTYNILRMVLWSSLFAGSGFAINKYGKNFTRLYEVEKNLEVFTQRRLIPKPVTQTAASITNEDGNTTKLTKLVNKEEAQEEQRKRKKESLNRDTAPLTAAQHTSLKESLIAVDDPSSVPHAMRTVLTAFQHSRKTSIQLALHDAGATSNLNLPAPPSEPESRGYQRLGGQRGVLKLRCSDGICVVQ